MKTNGCVQIFPNFCLFTKLHQVKKLKMPTTYQYDLKGVKLLKESSRSSYS